MFVSSVRSGVFTRPGISSRQCSLSDEAVMISAGTVNVVLWPFKLFS